MYTEPIHTAPYSGKLVVHIYLRNWGSVPGNSKWACGRNDWSSAGFSPNTSVSSAAYNPPISPFPSIVNGC